MDISTDFIKEEHNMEEMETGATDEEFSELCRVCAKMCTVDAEELFPAIPEITASLEYLFHIKLEEGDGLPTKLCCTCEGVVLEYNRLYKQVQQAQEFLKSRANQDPLAMPSTEQQESEDTSSSEDLEDTKPIVTEPSQELNHILMSLNSSVKSEPENSEDNSVHIDNNSVNNDNISVNNGISVNNVISATETVLKAGGTDAPQFSRRLNICNTRVNILPPTENAPLPQSYNNGYPVHIMATQFSTVSAEPLIVNVAVMPNLNQTPSNITPFPHNVQPVAHSLQSMSQPIPQSPSMSQPYNHNSQPVAHSLQSMSQPYNHNSQPVYSPSTSQATQQSSHQLPRLAPKPEETMELVHIDPSQHFQCGLCKTNFSSQLQLKMHLNLEIKLKSKKLIPCAHCTRQFKKVNLLLVHLMRHVRNSNVQNFTCEICNRSFKDSYGHKNHLRSHGEHKAFKCTLCGDSFKHRVSWYSHCQKKHNKVSNMHLEMVPEPQEPVPQVKPLIQARMSQFIPIQPKSSQ